MKNEIIEAFKKQGADIIRFGNVERFRDPAVKTIFPEARTVIGAAFRQLRGSRRGIEEGSTYYQYTTMAVEVLEENIMPRAMQQVCGVIERHGYEALPQRRNQLIMQAADDTNPEMDFSEIYRDRKAENQLDFIQCAVDCGLGEKGLSGSLLTDDFGPCQRYVFILTDAVIEPDPLPESHLCDHCGKCAEACPGKALGNNWQCAAYYVGANMSKNPFMPPDAFANDPERLKIIAGEAQLSPERAREIIRQAFFYPPIKQGYKSSICGRACDTACYIHLESKGVLKKSFKTPFRKRPEWKLPIS